MLYAFGVLVKSLSASTKPMLLFDRYVKLDVFDASLPRLEATVAF